ncbi:MAG: hypothetical protein CL927_19465 [Deltaproteobacteria bacterium]|nr:hypothetical protein [Deltaproteobacteria bacterium]HCH65627.1 hypothetical protein [Deltaproteobacteria bacterium]
MGSFSGSCGVPVEALFPRQLYRSGSGYLGVQRFSTAWWTAAGPVITSLHTGWFANRSFIRSFDSVTRSGSLWLGTASYSFRLQGESHALGAGP